MTARDLSVAQRQLADAQAELDGLVEGLEAQVLVGEEAAAKQLREKRSLRRLAELRVPRPLL